MPKEISYGVSPPDEEESKASPASHFEDFTQAVPSDEVQQVGEAPPDRPPLTPEEAARAREDARRLRAMILEEQRQEHARLLARLSLGQRAHSMAVVIRPEREHTLEDVCNGLNPERRDIREQMTRWFRRH